MGDSRERTVKPAFERFPENPVITPDMDARMGQNVNGPSLIRVPDWLEDPWATTTCISPTIRARTSAWPTPMISPGPGVGGTSRRGRTYLFYSVAGERGIAGAVADTASGAEAR